MHEGMQRRDRHPRVYPVQRTGAQAPAHMPVLASRQQLVAVTVQRESCAVPGRRGGGSAVKASAAVVGHCAVHR